MGTCLRPRQDLNPGLLGSRAVSLISLLSPNWQCDKEDDRAEAARARLWKEHLAEHLQPLRPLALGFLSISRRKLCLGTGGREQLVSNMSVLTACA